MLKKLSAKKVEPQATFFVCIMRSLINLWFSTIQIEETGKQTKLRWRVVNPSHIWQCYLAISIENSVELSTTLVRFYQLLLQQQQGQQQQIMQQPQQYYINENQRFRSDQSQQKLFINDERQLFETITSSRLIIKLKVH